MIKYNLYKATEIIKCEYCGRLTPKFHHSQKYCHKKTGRRCSEYARKEKNVQYVQKSIAKRKEYMDDRLGQSSLGSHPQKDFKKEERTIKNEIRRLGL